MVTPSVRPSRRRATPTGMHSGPTPIQTRPRRLDAYAAAPFGRGRATNLGLRPVPVPAPLQRHAQCEDLTRAHWRFLLLTRSTSWLQHRQATSALCSCAARKGGGSTQTGVELPAEGHVPIASVAGWCCLYWKRILLRYISVVVTTSAHAAALECGAARHRLDKLVDEHHGRMGTATTGVRLGVRKQRWCAMVLLPQVTEFIFTYVMVTL
jgi:hypothetical protein